ncbi:MAG: hypothetical protein IPM82_32770 [Saprospiraceae bacterium]|nr:hypothetical protein [Saprospiraceae bacterium]
MRSPLCEQQAVELLFFKEGNESRLGRAGPEHEGGVHRAVGLFFLLIAVMHKLHRRFARFQLLLHLLPFDLPLRFPEAGHRTGEVFFQVVGFIFEFGNFDTVPFGDGLAVLICEAASVGFQQVVFFSGGGVGMRQAFDLVGSIEQEAFVEKAVIVAGKESVFCCWLFEKTKVFGLDVLKMGSRNCSVRSR